MLRTILTAHLALPFMAVAQDLPSADTVLWNRFHAFETRLLAEPV